MFAEKSERKISEPTRRVSRLNTFNGRDVLLMKSMSVFAHQRTNSEKPKQNKTKTLVSLRKETDGQVEK